MPQTGAQSPYPDDFRPYTPNQPGVCDQGFTFIGTQCQPTNFDCPPGYRRAMANTPANATGTLAATCEPSSTPTSSSTSATPETIKSFLHAPQGWPLRAEVTGYILGNTPASIQPFSQLYAQPSDSPTISWSATPQWQLPSVFAEAPAAQPNTPAYQKELSGHAGGLADERVVGTPAEQSPSLTIAPVRGGSDTFADGFEHPGFVSPPATRGWLGSWFDRVRAWLVGQ
ncbi:hypothetical protein FJY94_01040 [Candidatus Kaiserbacteria bacterium]|nr:hypothetical protein [Candidatus Kaiserbacteria bacterium]